jgi:hypothetical protein
MRAGLESVPHDVPSDVHIMDARDNARDSGG